MLTIDDRPNSVTNLDVAEERVATANLDARTNGTPRARIIAYEADGESGELRVCRRSGPTLPEFDCAALVHEPQPTQRNELGLTASVDHLPTRLDVCLAADQGKFGRDGIVERVTCPGVAVPGGLAAEARLCNDFPLDCRGEQLLTSTVVGLNASSEVRINLFECTQVNVLAPSGLPVCVESAALDDFRLTRMHVQIDAPKALDTGYVYLDTGNNPVTGKITVIPNVAGKTGTEVRGNFVNLADDAKAFKADDRLVVAAVEIVGEDGALDPRHSVGSCQFAPGSDLEVRVGLLPAVEVINEICDKAE